MTRRPARTSARSLGLATGLAALAVPAFAGTAAATPAVCDQLVVTSGQTVVVDSTRQLCSLTIDPGGALVAPDGQSLTLTVDGVETGGVIESTGGEVTVLKPGTYRGKVVLTPAVANPIAWQGLTFPFRQALFVGATGVDESRSVSSAIVGGSVKDAAARNIAIRSTGENFNGVYVDGGTYQLTNPTIELDGNGRSDFVGYGAALTADGGSRVTVDGAQIDNQGVARTGVVAEGGSTVLVKNSTIHTEDGTLPADYQPTVDLALMQSAPWMLGIVGNVRATNLLGENTKATYLDSDISSSGWGVLSTDTGSDGHLTAINSTVRTTGGEGYGSYAIGNATEEFLGTRFDVDTYAAINRGGSIHYGDSTRSAVASLNTAQDLGLTAADLRGTSPQATTIRSKRWGVMWHGQGSVRIDGGTQLSTRRTTFLDKGQAVNLTVNGYDGAKVTTGNGVLFQLMDDDDPGPQFVDGKLLNTGVYREPTEAPTKAADFDVYSAHADDAVATFSDIKLKGSFYNALRGNAPDGPFGPGTKGRNLVLTFDGSSVTGALSSSTSRHRQDTITAADYLELGQVTNTASPAVNNGVLVTLAGGAQWKVTGTSYLTKLSVASDAKVLGATMTVDGVAIPIVPGRTYTGDIVVSRA